MNTNIYKNFRITEKLANRHTISKRFDEPTYFSFRLIFGHNNDDVYNIADNTALFDTMPHPLFDLGLTPVNLPATPRFGKMPQTEMNAIFNIEPHSYSAVQYLIEANEPTRAAMLQEFIQKFNQLQNDFPYYFQSIEGVHELLKINHTRGQRINNDTILTISCLEGLDLRMGYLMNLYRKIAWDDVYQRWVLPDMMRYFTLKIYLAEFRTFHMSQSLSQSISGLGGTDPGRNNFLQPNTPQREGDTPMYLTILDDILPTWEITCEMCEFDISNITYEHLNNLNVGADPNQGKVTFGIKVGNIRELQIYPMFIHKFLSDRILNGLNRSKEEQISTLETINNRHLYPASLKIAQAREQQVFDDSHISGLPFNEMRNSTIMFGQGGPGIDNNWGSPDDDVTQVNPTVPSTWVGNAINFGTAYAKNFVNKFINKGKITAIPGLGVSFNEVRAALESKNIVGALGLIRKGINEIVKQYGNAPSERLNKPLQTDEIMLQFLTVLTKSEATDDDTRLLQSIANVALTDKTILNQIQNYPIEDNKQDLYINQSFLQISPNAASIGRIDNINNINIGKASALLSEDINDKLSQGNASELIGINIQTTNLSNIPPSKFLDNKIDKTPFDIPVASNKLSARINKSKLQKMDPDIKINTVQIKHPKVSRATNNKLKK